MDNLTERCGGGSPHLWRLELDDQTAPALVPWLASAELRIGDLLRDPRGREHPLNALVLALLRDGESVITPGDDFLLRLEDQLLVAGGPSARRALDATLSVESTAAYVVDGRIVPSSWVWRRLSRNDRAQPRPPR